MIADQFGGNGNVEGSSSRSSDENFIGSQGTGSGDYLQEGGSSGNATGGSDFAEQGQGALDEDDSNSDSNQTDGSGSSGSSF
jgi:hypothetical protein